MFDLMSSPGQPEAMSSLDLLDLVNSARETHGEAKIRRADFLSRVKDELEGEYYETFVVSNSRGPASEAVRMTRDQCVLVAMRESKGVRREVLSKLKGRDNSPVVPVNLVHSYTDAVAGMEVVARMLRLEGSAALGLVRKATEITAPHLLPAIPVYAIDAPSGSGAASSESTASLSALMKANDIKGTAATMNVRLEVHGFLEKKIRASKSGDKSFWSITEAGLKYGKNLTSHQNQRETQPHWYRDKFLDLMSTINAK